jgi:hypothetical protein
MMSKVIIQLFNFDLASNAMEIYKKEITEKNANRTGMLIFW